VSFSSVFEEIDQRLEHFGREQGRLSRVPAHQALLTDVHGEIAELVVHARAVHEREIRITTKSQLFQRPANDSST
jgi:hypothetical protein